MSTGNSPLSMSDEDFLKLNDPGQLSAQGSGDEPGEEEEQEATVETDDGSEDPADGDETSSQDTETEAGDTGADEEGEKADDKSKDGESETGKEEAEPVDGEAVKAGGASDEPVSGEPGAEGKDSKTAETAGDFVVPSDVKELQEFYKSVLAPFKANGKLIQAKTPEEIKTLMQMGANYTKKMQDIQPHRKVLMLLEDNGLLDQGQLSFLVDLSKHDPAAIKKLLKDANVDPMDIDMESDPEYLGGNNQISDEQANFREVVQEVAQSDSGKETLQIIDSTWDDASKDAVWNQPEIIKVIQSQRDSGVYDQIVSELDRQKMLGKVSATLPFIQAYKLIGDQLFPAPTATRQEQQAPRKLGEKVAAPKPTVSNGDKASAAAPSRSTPRKTAQVVNPLDMPDEEFAKMAGIQI